MMGAVQVLGSILEAVGHTPLVRLHRITAGLRPTILAKVETLNPGGSVKDRIGLRMIEDAEQRGLLKPGGTIVEPTSGNTGHALAIAAAIKNYRMIFVMADKQSPEKIALLRAYGAEVVVCPTAVPRDSPESYYSVAERLSREITNGVERSQSEPLDDHLHRQIGEVPPRIGYGLIEQRLQVNIDRICQL